jgi:hypothetical protein
MFNRRVAASVLTGDGFGVNHSQADLAVPPRRIMLWYSPSPALRTGQTLPPGEYNKGRVRLTGIWAGTAGAVALLAQAAGIRSGTAGRRSGMGMSGKDADAFTGRPMALGAGWC